MEGWFWRIAEPRSGSVVIALGAVNRDSHGRRWGTVGLAAHPGGFLRAVPVDAGEVAADADGAGLRIGGGARPPARRGGGGRPRRAPPGRRPPAPGGVAVDLGDDARLEVALEAPGRWPRRAFGGLGAAQAIPWLSQYWHPWLLRARVRGHAVADGREIDLDGAVAYAEKNWSNGGFPERWWWGQAHGFADDGDACVAFAGGRAGVGPLRLTATSLVVSAGGELVRLVRPLQPLRVGVDGRGWRLSGRTPGGLAVEVEGHANGTPPHLLPVPVPAQRRHHEDAATQHLAGELRVELRRRGRVVFGGTSVLAGLEHGQT